MQPGMTPDQNIIDFLRTKNLLLVLDNCEHVIGTADRLADAVLRVPDVRVIASASLALTVSIFRCVRWASEPRRPRRDFRQRCGPVVRRSRTPPGRASPPTTNTTASARSPPVSTASSRSGWRRIAR
jgi:hypothetical protein